MPELHGGMGDGEMKDQLKRLYESGQIKIRDTISWSNGEELTINQAVYILTEYLGHIEDMKQVILNLTITDPPNLDEEYVKRKKEGLAEALDSRAKEMSLVKIKKIVISSLKLHTSEQFGVDVLINQGILLPGVGIDYISSLILKGIGEDLRGFSPDPIQAGLEVFVQERGINKNNQSKGETKISLKPNIQVGGVGYITINQAETLLKEYIENKDLGDVIYDSLNETTKNGFYAVGHMCYPGISIDILAKNVHEKIGGEIGRDYETIKRDLGNISNDRRFFEINAMSGEECLDHLKNLLNKEELPEHRL